MHTSFIPRRGAGCLLARSSVIILGLLGSALATAGNSEKVPTGMAVIGGGQYTPLFIDPTLPRKVQVDSYYLDRHLVSNADFHRFSKTHSKWSKSGVKILFADKQYLKHFPDQGVETNQSTESSTATAWSKQPVTNVSWFAARAYCAQQGKRLPSVDEWEYAARASETEVDATGSAEHRSRILAWYGKLTTDALPSVAETPRNVWGVQGMHGVVWEMVSDFNSVLVTGESRGDTQIERDLFCGAGAASSSNPADYAAFMRYALRSSYEASYTLESLGFRCAQNIKAARN